MDELDDYYELLFRGNLLYTAYAKQCGETLLGLFLARLLLKHPGGLCQRDLARLLGVPKQTMSRHLRERISAGLVREAPSVGDGREKIFSLTTAGKQKAHELIDPLNELELSCLGTLGGNLAESNELNRRYLDAFEKLAIKSNQ